MDLDREWVFDLMQSLDEAEVLTEAAFFQAVADDVIWTIMSGSAEAKVFRAKSELFESLIKVSGLLKPGLTFTIEHCFVAGDTAIVEMRSRSTFNDGRPYPMPYCWILKFDGQRIVEVRAYLDTLLFQQLLETLPTSS